MNRFLPSDSKELLDEALTIWDSGAMIVQPYQLYVERTEPTKNMARYYAMSIEPTLFGDASLTRRWGRIGKSGQRLVHHFDREEEAVRLFLSLLCEKRSRGYKPKP